MTTYAQLLVESLDEGWSEINLLISEAERRQAELGLHNALCRSASVLMVARFENYIREVVKAILADINRWSSFRDAPSAIKQTFCRSFFQKEEGMTGGDFQARVQNLMNTFDGLATQFTVEPFMIKDVQGHSRNPAPSTVDKILTNLGIAKFFKIIDVSDLDIAFSGTLREVMDLKQRIKLHLISGVANYPYTLNSTSFNIGATQATASPPPVNRRTLWQEFLDETMKMRNDIAHGSISNNPSSVQELQSNLLKLEILQMAILMVTCEKSV